LTPAPNQTDVPARTSIQVLFSESVQPPDGNQSGFELKDALGNPVPTDPVATQWIDDKLIIQPLQALRRKTINFVTILGPVTDLSGNPLAGGSFTWSFETEAVLPAALYNLTRTPEHFTGQVSSMTFSMTVSRALSNIRF